MGSAARKFEVVEGGWLEAPVSVANQPTNQPLTNLETWLTTGEVQGLAGVSLQAVQKAIAARRWRGTDLIVREEAASVGRGGKVLQVHVDSLPADLREAWYLARGIVLHERLEPSTGLVVQVPGDATQHDPRWSERAAVARWRLDVIRQAVAQPKGSRERKAALDTVAKQVWSMPDGRRKSIAQSTLYNWVTAYDAQGLAGLMPDVRKDKGVARAVVTVAWDAFFGTRIGEGDRQQIGEELTGYIRSMWRSGASGWRTISEMSTTRLIEMSRDLRDLPFDRLPLGALTDPATAQTQFGICTVSGRRVREEAHYKMLAIRDKDNAVFQDTIMPTVRRDYSALKPREIIVGDVHPMDIMVRRPNGRPAYPKAISWYDPATAEVYMTIVLLEEREGIRREHVAMSFEGMVAEWGLPKTLYLDNGSEYGDPAMMNGFSELSKLVGMTVKEDSRTDERVRDAETSVIRSKAYNAKGKPGIEGLFGNLERVFFSHVPGWTAGERMRKKTHAKGRDPIPFNGDMDKFLEVIRLQLDHYHKRPARTDKKSPNERLREHIEAGWGKTVLKTPEVLALAFSTVVERTVDRGTIQFAARDGGSKRYYCESLLLLPPGTKVTIRVPAYNPEFLFCFDQTGKELGIARPEERYHPLDPAGALEQAARSKFLRRYLREQSRNCALLDLTDEAARHVGHLPAAPEMPVTAVIDAGMYDRMVALEAEDRARRTENATTPRREITQFKTGPNAALAAVEYEDDEE